MAALKVAIVGAGGLLGRALVDAMVASPGCSVVPWTRGILDLRNDDAVEATIARVRPDAVINTAAFHGVDVCQKDPPQAFDVNALGALRVARACAACGAVPVFISTSYVFNGTSPDPYSEDDTPDPLMIYGISKLAGEQLTRITAARSIVCRVAHLYGPGPAAGGVAHFIDRVLADAVAGNPITADADSWTSPTFTVDAARALVSILMAGVTGTFHVVNRGACTWWELAVAALRCAHLDVAVRRREGRVAVPVRPRQAALRSERLERAGISPLRAWPEAVAAYVQTYHATPERVSEP